MRLALKLLWRDWRGGELRLLALSVVVAVAAVTSVAWLADRVAGATEARAADLLAADRAVEYPRRIPDDWRERAEAQGLRTALTAAFPSVVVSGERTQLVAVKAVTEGYPLRGELRTRAASGADERKTKAVPEPGHIWVAPRLLTILDREVGDELALGDASFEIARILTLEPDRGGFVDNIAPRVLMNHTQLAGTGLIGEGSRVRYKLLLAGATEALVGFTDTLVAEHGNSVEIETPTGDRRGVSEVVTKARRFLGLAALLTVVVAGVAVLLTVRHYAERQTTGVAVMRALGATRRRLTGLFVGKLLWLGLIAGALGSVLGFGLHLAMLAFVADLLGEDLPPPGFRPMATGWLTAVAALFGFALPTLLRLRDVPPMRVLRRDLGQGMFRGATPLLVAVGVILALMAWQAGDVKLTAFVFGALVATLAVLAAVAGAVVGSIRWLTRARGGRLLWLTGVTRRPGTAVIQIVAVGVGLMSLFLLGVVRGDLLDAWRDRIPEDAPNQFLVNIQPDQRDDLQTLLSGAGVDTAFRPMARGRLTARDGESIEPEDYSGEDRDLLQREFNLSWAAEPREGNEVIAGDWWTGDDPSPQLSLERDYAERLGFEIGDELTFEVAGREVTAEITNLRSVQWDSFNVNFFIMASPGTLDDVPVTYLTSFYLPPERDGLIAEIVREYPSVTPVDVTAILRTVRTIMDQGTRVVELMSLLTLIAGVLVLLAALQITGEQRRFESALLRALGATGKRVRRLFRYELWLIGGVAGVMSGSAATLAGVVVAEQLFDLSYPFNPWIVIAGGATGVATVWVAGAWGARRFYRVSPMALLREGDD
jgi:putative ABC transport system permease protein